jgi:cytochrome c oxidase cbb3-type subunit 3
MESGETFLWKKYTGGRSPLIGKILSPLVLFVVLQPHFSAGEDQSEGKRLYQTYCTGCHGASGKGDGPAGKTLPVKPADHTNAKKMSQYSDDHLFTVISKGGPSVGKSPQMPAWGAVLKEPQIHEVVSYIRTLSENKKAPVQPSGPAK